MRVGLVILSLLVIIAWTGCNGTPTSTHTTQPKTVSISIVDSAFQPNDTTINVNDTIEWTNDGLRDHTSTSGLNGTPDGTWDSGTLQPGAKFSWKFTQTGTFNYFCRFHFASGMTGKVTVVTP